VGALAHHPSITGAQAHPTRLTSLRGAKRRGNPDAFIQNAFDQMPYRSTGSPRCARDDSHPLSLRGGEADAAIQHTRHCNKALATSEARQKRSRRGNPDAFIQHCFWPPALLIRWIATLRSR